MTDEVPYSLNQPDKTTKMDFEKELAALLNKHNMDSATNTPDFILARHIIRDLDTLRETNQEVDRWRNNDKTDTSGRVGSKNS